MNRKIEHLRDKLDQIDEKIYNLLEERFQLTDEIGNEKRKNNLSIEDLKREVELEEKIKSKFTDPILTESVIRIFNQIIRESKSRQNREKF